MNVGVHANGRDPEGASPDQVRRLPSHSREGQQVLHTAGHPGAGKASAWRASLASGAGNASAWPASPAPGAGKASVAPGEKVAAYFQDMPRLDPVKTGGIYGPGDSAAGKLEHGARPVRQPEQPPRGGLGHAIPGAQADDARDQGSEGVLAPSRFLRLPRFAGQEADQGDAFHIAPARRNRGRRGQLRWPRRPSVGLANAQDRPRPYSAVSDCAASRRATPGWPASLKTSPAV